MPPIPSATILRQHRNPTMNRNLIFAAPLVAALALSGCQTTGANSVVAQVQAIAQAACAFVPTAATIIAIVAKGNPALATAAEMATAICAAVAPKPAARLLGALAPSVDGVIVEGHFVR